MTRRLDSSRGSEPILKSGVFGGIKARAVGGLHAIQGNALPYFSLTLESWRNGREDTFGAAHEIILKYWPELADLAALHLSDSNGLPMHAEANGAYWLSGIVDGGEKYRPEQSAEECAVILAKHLRCSARTVRVLAYSVTCGKPARETMAEYVAGQMDRFKGEANYCIARHGLEVYS